MAYQHLYTFKPILKQTLWGGNNIIKYKSLKSLHENIGESWEISDLPGYESIVTAGECVGMTLKELIAAQGEELMGKHNLLTYGKSFPLLIKFIDANADLSVQVHPNNALAAQRHGCVGKTEMWYVIATRPGAYLYTGFSKQITTEEYNQRIKNGTLLDVLQRYEVKPGDVFYIPAGCIHSIGEGCFICEIQQNSDITYRIFDWGRVEANGKARQLHIEEAKDAIDFTINYNKVTFEPHLNEITRLVQSPYFTTSICRLNKPMILNYLNFDSFIIYICVHGALTVQFKEEKVTLHEGDTLLASSQCKYLKHSPHTTAEFLITYPALPKDY